MAKKKNTRRALFMSVISLILCCAMLMGTTFAWFTDSVTSGVNQINAGNLDVELYHTDKAASNEKVTASVKLFDDVTLWEPGAVAYENLQIANEGTLALKYQMALTFANATQTPTGGTLADVLKVAVVEGGFDGDRAAAQDLTYGHTLSTFSLAGQLAGDSKSNTYGVVIYWEPTDNDNAYNMNNENQGKALSIDLGIQLNATQLEYESDSFGPDYDETASMKTTASEDGSATLTAPSAPSATVDNTTIEAPAGAFEPSAEVEVVVSSDNSLFNVSSNGAVVATLDVTLLVDGEEYSAVLSEGKLYTVKTYISTGLTEVAVTYTGTDDKDQPTFVSYDSGTGLLVFTTNHFSEYAVFAKAYGYTGDTAYGTVQDAADAIANGTTVKVADSDKQAVLEKLPADKQNEFKQENAAAKVGNNTYFLSFAEAMNHAAKTSGATVTLLTDTTMDADNTVKIPSGITTTLDLNNHTLSGVADETGSNREMFLVKGTLIVKNGTIQMSATQNQGWNAMSTIFDITDGGEVRVENATIKNLGGTDMNFAAHLNNWGTATLKVENSTLEATYIPVRVFNSGNDMNNVTIQNSVLNGKYCFWVHNYTLADFGTAEKVEAHKALLNFKIFNNGNTFNNTGKAPVLYGFTDAVYLDANGQFIASDSESLNAALAEGGTVVLTEKIEISKIDLTTGTKDISIDAGGNIITTTEAYGVEVAPGKNITLSNANVEMTKEGDYITYAAGFKIANGDYQGATITLKNCSISMANGDWSYAVNMPASVQNLNLVIDNCTLEGAIAVQCWGDNNTIKITNSKLICTYTTNEQYTSHCVALQNDGTSASENNTLEIENCEFSYNGIDNFDSQIHSVTNDGNNNSVTVTNCTYGDKIVAPTV